MAPGQETFIIDPTGAELLAKYYQRADMAPAILDVILKFSADAGASDILFEPQDESSLVQIRIDGALQPITRIPNEVYPSVISRIKVMAALDITQHRTAQEGKIVFQFENRTIDIRVAIADVATGEMAVLRLHDSSTTIYSLEQLGMQEPNVTEYMRLLSSPNGLILTCGPTGSGKTSTLYSSIQLLNDGLHNIISIEDPIEYLVPGVNQMQVDNEHGISFAEGLRVILRLNPNVIFIGEIRDDETAHIAIESALTGHLVLSTIHASSAVAVLFRLVDLGIEKFFLNSALLAVVSQRLVRKVCEHCAEEVVPSPEEIDYYQRATGRALTSQRQGRGCPQCSLTGYKGRIGIYEILTVDKNLRSLISQNANEQQIEAALLARGYQTLIQDGLNKVDQKLTTVREILTHAYTSL